MSEATNGNDAQRELEQKALKNVRALVDKLEEKEVLERTSQKKILIWLLVGMALVAVVLYLASTVLMKGKGSEVREIKSSPAASTPKQ